MPRFQASKPGIGGLTLDELQAWLKEHGQPAFRAKQILQAYYQQRVAGWDAVTTLSKPLRAQLEEAFQWVPTAVVLRKQASDTTDKLLLRLEDGQHIETVIIKAPRFHDPSEGWRRTICISTQVGCAYGCRFCASGLDGWKRDLTAAEIVSQLIHVCREIEPEAGRELPFDNIVVMGMGEPLANYDALLRALGNLNAPWGLHFGARRITVSTSGLVPQIHRLAAEPIQFRLAISLHGATNAVREQIMPINRRYPIEELIPAAEDFAQKHGRMLTLEYILIHEVNDGLDQAKELAAIARRLHAHINLIPYNRVEGLDWVRPSITRQDRFLQEVQRHGARGTIRREKGHDIDAACGQLRLKTERDLAEAS